MVGVVSQHKSRTTVRARRSHEEDRQEVRLEARAAEEEVQRDRMLRPCAEAKEPARREATNPARSSPPCERRWYRVKGTDGNVIQWARGTRSHRLPLLPVDVAADSMGTCSVLSSFGILAQGQSPELICIECSRLKATLIWQCAARTDRECGQSSEGDGTPRHDTVTNTQLTC